HRAELERKHRGKIALILGDELIGSFRTREKAIRAIIDRYGRPEPCLWQVVGAPVELMPVWGLPERDTPLPEREPAEVYFAQENATYERHRADLERNHMGEFALVHGDTLVGVYRDEDVAHAEGRRRFEKFMIREIGDPVIWFPLNTLPPKREG
ncbi:MAG TPA: hypothetical protein VFW33_19990, partial [Gemmataceae bacterium]|nr:hypothetical protein [Gemmataceae bacterium]